MKKLIVRLLLLTLLAVILGLFLYTANARLLGDALPMPLGFSVSRVLTGSMEPALSPNDLIVIRRTDTLYRDQLVVYQSGGSLVVHRVLEINGDEIITKGDANNAPDKPITRDMIKGEVLFSIPLAGAVVGVLQSPFAVLALLLISLLLLERSFHEEKKRRKDELAQLKEELRDLSEHLK